MVRTGKKEQAIINYLTENNYTTKKDAISAKSIVDGLNEDLSNTYKRLRKFDSLGITSSFRLAGQKFIWLINGDALKKESTPKKIAKSRDELNIDTVAVPDEMNAVLSYEKWFEEMNIPDVWNIKKRQRGYAKYKKNAIADIEKTLQPVDLIDPKVAQFDNLNSEYERLKSDHEVAMAHLKQALIDLSQRPKFELKDMQWFHTYIMDNSKHRGKKNSNSLQYKKTLALRKSEINGLYGLVQDVFSECQESGDDVS